LRDDKGLYVMQAFSAPVKSIGAHFTKIACKHRSARDAVIVFGIALVAYLAAEYLAFFDGIGDPVGSTAMGGSSTSRSPPSC
jgi:hypothetical protein